MSDAIAWQPMPPPASWPGSTMVERLCGQPEQKPGERAGAGSISRPAISATRASLAETLSGSPRPSSTRARACAMSSGSSSPVTGNSGAPAASNLPRIRGRQAASYSSSRSCSSRKLRFSSTTSSVSSPPANSRTNSGSSGNVTANFATRMPSLARSASRRPRSRNACCKSWYGFPAAAIPSQAFSRAPPQRFRRFSRRYARTASSRRRTVSCSSIRVYGVTSRASNTFS